MSWEGDRSESYGVDQEGGSGCLGGRGGRQGYWGEKLGRWEGNIGKKKVDDKGRVGKEIWDVMGRNGNEWEEGINFLQFNDSLSSGKMIENDCVYK